MQTTIARTLAGLAAIVALTMGLHLGADAATDPVRPGPCAQAADAQAVLMDAQAALMDADTAWTVAQRMHSPVRLVTAKRLELARADYQRASVRHEQLRNRCAADRAQVRI